LDRALLVKFMQRTYQEMFPQDFSHLARTVEQYFSQETPLWWVDFIGEGAGEQGSRGAGEHSSFFPHSSSPVACLWVGNAVDQVQGDRNAHIFLLYVIPEHRRRGIGTALMRYGENWAIARGDRQIGLQVFQSNQSAINLYNQLGYQTKSFWMVKSLDAEKLAE
jgi:ribosomal protein S18 acetylase RimI-like enzyme